MPDQKKLGDEIISKVRRLLECMEIGSYEIDMVHVEKNSFNLEQQVRIDLGGGSTLFLSFREALKK